MLERLSSLEGVWEMRLCGNRLWHSLSAKGPRRQPWGEDMGATASPRGQQPALPGSLPCCAQTPRGQGPLHFSSFAAQNRKSQNIGLSLS